MTTNYPFTVKDIHRDMADDIKKYFKGLNIDCSTADYIKKYFKGLSLYNGFVSIGPKGYFYPKTSDIKEQMASIYNMRVRPSDVFVTTFPRSGTTLTQELVWLVANNLDYDTASSQHLVERYTTLGSYFINTEVMASRLKDFEYQNSKHLNKLKRMIASPTTILANTSGPRFIKCHIPLSLLPPDVLVGKMVYVARDPRDVAVSLYHLSKLLVTFDFIGDFKTFWSFFVKGLIVRGPYFEQVKEAWALKDHPNMLFLFYEDISNDMSKTIRRVSDFLGKQYSDEQIEGLCEHLTIENFKRNQSVNLDFLNEFNALKVDEQPFVRNGKSGGWRDYFDEEMLEQAETWIEDNLRDTDLRFTRATR